MSPDAHDPKIIVKLEKVSWEKLQPLEREKALTLVETMRRAVIEFLHNRPRG